MMLSSDRPSMQASLAAQGWTLQDQMGDGFTYSNETGILHGTMGQCSRWFVVWIPSAAH